MFKPRRIAAYSLGVAGLLVAMAAQAYPPYGYGPYPGYAPPMGTYGLLYGYGPPTMGAPERTQGLRVTRNTDAEAYYITIDTSGIDPKAVQVRVEGRWILIGLDRSTQDSTQQSFDEGRGYARSYSYSTGQTNRRFTVPQDADTQAMRREETEDQVRIIIPRRRN